MSEEETEECLLGHEHPDDIQAQLEGIIDCLNCKVENCPVKEVLMKWRRTPL